MARRRTLFIAGLALLFGIARPVAVADAQTPASAPGDIVVGQVRVQLLSDSLVRIEVKGPKGFEDRRTFHVVDRAWPGVPFSTNGEADELVIRTPKYVVRVPENAVSLQGVRVESPDGVELAVLPGKLENNRWLPGPADKPGSWWFADAPRLIPPPWGLTPAAAGSAYPETSGWDLGNNAADVYVFVPGGDYRRLRADFLKLTGPTEMVPLYALGAFDSRWYDYSERSALEQIQDYRSRKIPLDVLVVDTGWRQNASTGYQPNTNLFPVVRRFFDAAHARHVRVMFNDHPEPKSARALDPEELEFRFDGLGGLLKEGLDIWWYDRNWMVSLVPPEPGLDKEVWGMRLYHDITARVKPGLRPLIMANVDGIDNGMRRRAPDVAAHRYPIQWTGDIGPGFDFLRRGVENAVHSGVEALFPYMSEDLGGHTSNPTTEEYIRWIEYGALSPIYRPHCTHNLMRMPWVFGPEAERIARGFLEMRYRLLPVLYAAARENYETGAPILRRLDLDYPQFAEAARDDQYLIGRNILVAPVLQGAFTAVPGEWLKTGQERPGLQAEYFANETLSGPPALTRTDTNIDFNWGDGSPGVELPRDHFTARWTGTVEVPASLGAVVLGTVEDDGARVWIDGKELIDAWGPHDSGFSEASAPISAGRPHQIRVEYLEQAYNAVLRLQWRAATGGASPRVLWIPPGDWIDAWTGDVETGPAVVTNYAVLDHIPMYIRSGAMVPLAPPMQYTGELPWDPITLDLYPRGGEIDEALLYEDDTVSTAYQGGQFRKTQLSAYADSAGKSLRVEIGAAAGNFAGALTNRSWVVRFRRPSGWPKGMVPIGVKIDGKQFGGAVRSRSRSAMAMPLGDSMGAPDGEAFEVNVPGNSVAKKRAIEIDFAPGGAG